MEKYQFQKCCTSSCFSNLNAFFIRNYFFKIISQIFEVKSLIAQLKISKEIFPSFIEASIKINIEKKNSKF